MTTRGILHGAWLLALGAACGATHAGLGGDDGGPGGGDASAPDGSLDDGALGDGATLDGAQPLDAGPDAWDGALNGPLTCAAPGTFAVNWSGSCGVERWTYKTGTDNLAAGISLVPQLTTIQSLVTLPAPNPIPFNTRSAPVEKTVYGLENVRLVFARLEQDSDYHLVLSDGTNTVVTEIPYPGGCTNNSVWQCLISRARAAVDAQKLNLTLNNGHDFNLPVSVIGVGFFDPEHGQFGAAPNTLELHPILAICFGAGCNPAD